MGLRPAHCYRRLERPYTRQSTRVPKRGYVKGVPKPKITEFELGQKGDYPVAVLLNSERAIQIRHNALESARISTVQILEKNLGKGIGFLLKIRPYPHHVLRENALATGAGADRFQQGMRMSFGKPVSTAARVRVGQTIIEVRTNVESIRVAKLALKAASYKLPTPCRIVVKELKTVPKVVAQ